jgi:hypothetical protein
MYTIESLILFNLGILFICFLFSKIQKFDFYKLLILSIIISSYFGFRDLNVGADTLNYYNNFINSINGPELGFTLLNNLIFTFFGGDHKIYFSLINFIMIMNLLIASKLIIKNPIYIFIAWIIVSLPYSILMQVNIIRQGLALSFFVLGYSLILKGKNLFGFLFFLVSISLHSSFIIYVSTYLLTFLFDIKKDTKVIFLIIISIISITGLPFQLINSLEIPYLDTRFSFILSSRVRVPAFSKISFYLIFYLVIEYFMIEKNLSNRKLSLFTFFIIFTSISIIQNDLFSIRYLLALDFLLPIYLLSKATYYKNKNYYLVSILVIFFVFIVSIYSPAFRLNFYY